MTKRNRILCLCLAILATAAVAFFLLYPHTTGPVFPGAVTPTFRQWNSAPMGNSVCGLPKQRKTGKKNWSFWTFWQRAASRLLLPNHETDWSGDASQRQYMLIVIQNGSNLVNIDLAQDDIVGEGPFNMVFSDGCLFPSRGYLLTPGEIRTFVERTLDDANYTVSSAV